MGVKDKAVSVYETYLFQGLLFCYDVEQIRKGITQMEILSALFK